MANRNSHRALTKELLVRMGSTEHAFLKEESELLGISMARILVHSFIDGERPTREAVRQREETIFVLRRIRLDLRAMRQEFIQMHGYDEEQIKEVMTELKAALGALGEAFRRGD